MSLVDQTLLAVLEETRPARVYYFPNPGNAGDSLIAHATYELFKRQNIDFELIVGPDFDSRGKTLIYGRGGNLIEGLYSDASRFIARHHATAARLVIFPHSVVGFTSLLSALGPNVVFFCREPVSYSHVRRHAHKATVVLSHDLALSLDPLTAIRWKCSFVSSLATKTWAVIRRDDLTRLTSPSPKWYLHDAFTTLRLSLTRQGTSPEHPLSCLRRDSEKTDDSTTHNFDLSDLFEHNCTQSPAIAGYVSHRLLTSLNRFSSIRTNRLHICIAAALLGKSVELLPNSYFKCEAIYEHSLRDRFPNIRWAGGGCGLSGRRRPTEASTSAVVRSQRGTSCDGGYVGDGAIPTDSAQRLGTE